MKSERDFVDSSVLDANLQTHLIEPQQIRADDFEAFFRTRQESLLSVIQSVMGKALVRDPSEEWIPDDVGDDDEPPRATLSV